MPVASGEMRHRLTLFAPEGTSNAHAGVATDIAKAVAAKIEELPLQFQQNERLAAGGLQSQTYYNVTVWYRPDVQMDFQWHEECCTRRVFQILSKIQNDTMTQLSMTCVVG